METTGQPLFHFETRERDEFEDRLAAVAPNIELRSHSSEAFSGQVRAARLSRVGLFTARIQGTQVLSPEGRGYTGLTLPIEGRFSVRSGSSRTGFDAGTSHLLQNEEPFDFAVSRPARVLVANFDQELVDGHLSHCRDSSSAPDLPSEISLVTPAGANLQAHLRHAWSDIESGAPWLQYGSAIDQMEALLCSLFVVALDHSETVEGAPDAGMQALARATEFIHAHLTDPISLADIVAEAGVSSRSLQRAFHHVHRSTPLRYLRDCRLMAAHEDLLASDPITDSVTEIAYRYGFFHLSRFAGRYRDRHGELPSDSLRRSRP